MHILQRWDIESWIRAATVDKVDKHEVYSLSSTVGRLEHSVRELSASLDSVRSELSQLQESRLNDQY